MLPAKRCLPIPLICPPIALLLSYLQKSFENGLLHVSLAIFGLLQDELVQVVLRDKKKCTQ